MVLYYWRSHADSTAADITAKPYTMAAARAALREHLERSGLKGKVKNSTLVSTYKVQYAIEGKPLISIVIPNMDHVGDLRKCIDSIRDRSTYGNWEIVIVENNSRDLKTFEYYRELERDRRIRVVTYEAGKEFNYPAINNFGAKAAKGEYLLLLNNDIEVISPDWMEQMLMFAQRKDVGAVGALLYYPDDTVQHAGVIVGVGGVAGHAHKYSPRGSGGYVSRLTIAQNFSAVTAACMLMRKDVWEQVGGLNVNYAVAFNDVDLCLRIRKAGYLIVWTPYAEMYHYESKSRGDEDSIEKQTRFQGEIDRFHEEWGEILEQGDPYYNPNLTLAKEDFSLREE
jgi:GT2 family glycosyltransferase